MPEINASEVREPVSVFFIILDEDDAVLTKQPAKKVRAIVEVDTDGAYAMGELSIEESDKVKTFDKFIPDLEKLVALANPHLTYGCHTCVSVE